MRAGAPRRAGSRCRRRRPGASGWRARVRGPHAALLRLGLGQGKLCVLELRAALEADAGGAGRARAGGGRGCAARMRPC